MRVVMIGPPGAGKGTQARSLSDRYGVPQISTGDMLRDAQREGTALGREAQRYMDDGRLVPDDIVIGIVEQRLAAEDSARGFILDGFPRTVAQAEALDAMLGQIGRGLDAILFFDVPDAVGMERALRRAELEGRSDDTPEAIAKRLAVYHEQTEPVVEHYRVTAKLVPLHAGRSIEEVWAEIAAALEQVAA